MTSKGSFSFPPPQNFLLMKFRSIVQKLWKLARELIKTWKTHLVFMINLLNHSLQHKLDAWVRWGGKRLFIIFIWPVIMAILLILQKNVRRKTTCSPLLVCSTCYVLWHYDNIKSFFLELKLKGGLKNSLLFNFQSFLQLNKTAENNEAHKNQNYNFFNLVTRVGRFNQGC